MPKSKQEIIDDIKSHMQKHGGEYSKILNTQSDSRQDKPAG